MKKNVGSQIIACQLVATADGANVTSGPTTVTVELDGAAGTGGTATHIANGKWEYQPIQADTNADHVTFQFTNSTAVSVLLNVYPTFPQTVDLKTGITAGTITTVGTLTGHTVQTGDSYAAMGATAWTALQDQYDGVTGLSGDLYPATQASVNGIGSGSAGAVNIKATEDNSAAGIDPGTVPITKVGTITGDFNNVHADTGGATIVSIAAVGNDVGYVLGYNVTGAKVGVSASVVVNVNGNADSIAIETYDHITGDSWDVVGIVNGTGGASYVSKDVPLYPEHTGTGAELGKVYMRFNNNGTTPSLLQVDRCSVSAVSTSTSVGYAMGAYWIDSTGTSGTEIGTNGTADNPCPWANAITMNGTQSLNRFVVANGNTVTLSANSDAYTLIGENWNLALNSQSIEGISVCGAYVTGTGTATVTRPAFKDCSFGICTIPPCTTDDCSFGVGDGLFTAGSAGDYDHHLGRSAVAGSGSPDFDYTIGSGTTNVQNRAWTGGAVYTMDSTTTLSHEVLAGGGTTINSGGGDAEIRGVCRDLTLVMAGSETIQFVGITGDVNISGTTSGTVQLDGVSSSMTNTTSGPGLTPTDNTIRKAELITIDGEIGAVKVKTDQMVFTNTNELDANTKSINDAEVIGDGNATPWDGV